MSVVLLYLLLLKGTATAFAGLASLPVVQDALVFHYHVLTDKQLNEAVVITRSTPGPVGLYIVSVGYFVAGIPGAIAGWLAMVTPAFLIIPLVHFAGRNIEHPRVKGVLQTVVIASAGLLLAGRANRSHNHRHCHRELGAVAHNRTRYALDNPRRGCNFLVGSIVRPHWQIFVKGAENASRDRGLCFW
jgi:chromate transporter